MKILNFTTKNTFVFIKFFIYICFMSKKTTKWETIFKDIDEKFELLSYEDCNMLPTGDGEDIEEEVFNMDGNRVVTRPVNNQWATKTSVPYIQKKDIMGIKHVEVGYFTAKGGIQFIGEKEWLEKSVNILNSALVRRTTLVLEKNEDKIKLSLFNFCKSRSVGHRYFAKQSNDIHVTFNLKTKNFYITKSTFVNRRRRVSTTKNDFSKIINIINPLKFINTFGGLTHPNPHTQPFVNTLSHTPKVEPTKALVELVEELDVDISVVPHDSNSPSQLLSETIVKWFIKVWGIKTPNDYTYYLLKHYPGIKKLRKYDMNLIHTILGERGLKGKFYNKLLNREPEINITDLHFLQKTLGDDGLKRISTHLLAYSKTFEDTKFSQPEHLISEIGYCDKLSKYEKNNIINIYNTCKDPTSIGGFIDLMLDHFKIKNKLQGYGILKNIKAKTLDKFNEEHSEWSNLVHECERTTQVNYLYPNDFITHIEKPIELDGNKYFVKLLKDDNDYFKEGQIQNHCVRTYLDRYKSIIISVRKNHESGMERMTCEFNEQDKVFEIGKDMRGVKGRYPTLTQARMKYNNNPTGDWEVIMRLLRKEFLDYSCKPKNNTRPIIKISNKMTNHVETLKYNKKVDRFISDDVITHEHPSVIVPITPRVRHENYMRDDLPF